MKAFSGYHPLTLLIYFLSVLMTAMFLWNPVIQLEALLGAGLFAAMLQNGKETAGDILFYIPLFIMAALANPLFSHNGVTILFFMNGNPVTAEAFIYGIALAVTLIAVLLWCKCYSIIMSSDKFIYLFGRAIPKLSLVLSMALRFVPLFKRRFHKVRKAQRAMGMYSSKSYTDRLKGTLLTFSAVTSWSLENAMETSASMKARGYGLAGRSNFSIFRFAPHDFLLLAFNVLLMLGTLMGAAFGELEFYYYPQISGSSLSVPGLLAYVCFGVLTLLPFIIELKEKILWKYFISKI